MASLNYETGLAITKSTGEKMARQLFHHNKRVTQVTITAYNVIAVYEYSGQRKEEQDITPVLVRHLKRDQSAHL